MQPKDPRVQAELDSLNRVSPKKPTVKSEGIEPCQHNSGFSIHWGNVWQGKVKVASYPAVWRCNFLCGYFLNFNPEIFPEGIAYLERPKKEKKVPLSRVSKY